MTTIATETNATESTTDAVRMLQVFTTPQKCAAGQEVVTAGTRASEGKNIPADQKMRCIIIPELAVDNVPSKFQSLVMNALRRTAIKQLATIWKNEPMVREVPLAVWSVDSLLLFAAKQAEGTRLTRDNLLEWFTTSKLCAHIMGQNNAKMYENWKDRILSLAAPVLALNEAQCNVTIATIGKFEEDAATPMAEQMIGKLTKRLEAIAQQNEELDAV